MPLDSNSGDDEEQDDAGLGTDAAAILAAIDLNAEVEKPTLDNFHTYKDRMSLDTIRAYLALRTQTNSNPSDAALAALETAELNFRKSVALIAWACDLTETSAARRA